MPSPTARRVVTDCTMANLDGLEMAGQLQAEQLDLIIVECSVPRPHELLPDLPDLGACLEKPHAGRLAGVLTRLLHGTAG